MQCFLSGQYCSTSTVYSKNSRVDAPTVELVRVLLAGVVEAKAEVCVDANAAVIVHHVDLGVVLLLSACIRGCPDKDADHVICEGDSTQCALRSMHISGCCEGKRLY